MTSTSPKQRSVDSFSCSIQCKLCLLLIGLTGFVGCDGPPGPAEIRSENPNAEYAAAHILIMHKECKSAPPGISRSKDEAFEFAMSLSKQARAEGVDMFGELASKNSDGPSKVKGGDLGVFTYSTMVAPFSAATDKLQIGEISDPVETSFGYHVILRKPLPRKVKLKEILISWSGSRYTLGTVTRSKDAAEALKDDCLKRIKDGEEFKTLVSEFSDDNSKQFGGDIGAVTENKKSLLPKIWYQAAFDLEVDETVMVETDFGYHILKRYE